MEESDGVAMTTSADSGASRARYSLLMVALGVTYVLSLVVNQTPGGLSFLIAVQLVTIWLTMRVAQAPRLTRLAGFALIVLLVALVCGSVFGQLAGRVEQINQWMFVLSTILYLTAPIVIVRHILMRRSVDVEALLAVISAYFMIGLAFAFLYRVLGAWQPGEFFAGAGEGTLADDLFFSFTSLTTVGYGNLVPAANPGQSLAVFEAIFGQLFLVVVVAKVVTGLSRQSSGTQSSD